jgi:hypothetical protein
MTVNEEREYAVLRALYALGSQASLADLSAALVAGDAGKQAAPGHSETPRQVQGALLRFERAGLVERARDGTYLLIPKGRETYLRQLKTREPDSPLLKRKLIIIDAHVEPLQEGGYLASCDEIQGCHAEGETVAEALANLEDVARI